ncbi:MAG: hypothetical protein M3R25_10395 [Bacteroidota bacterium]|nr:hypothetical protein [Bacteroidota bacterium]
MKTPLFFDIAISHQTTLASLRTRAWLSDDPSAVLAEMYQVKLSVPAHADRRQVGAALFPMREDADCFHSHYAEAVQFGGYPFIPSGALELFTLAALLKEEVVTLSGFTGYITGFGSVEQGKSTVFRHQAGLAWSVLDLVSPIAYIENGLIRSIMSHFHTSTAPDNVHHFVRSAFYTADELQKICVQEEPALV